MKPPIDHPSIADIARLVADHAAARRLRHEEFQRGWDRERRRIEAEARAAEARAARAWSMACSGVR